jgi:hypothetical protein
MRVSGFSKERTLAPSADKEATPGLVIKDRTPVECRRDCLLMLNDRVKVGCGLEPSFDCANKAFKTTEAIEFFPVSNLSGIE